MFIITKLKTNWATDSTNSLTTISLIAARVRPYKTENYLADFLNRTIFNTSSICSKLLMLTTMGKSLPTDFI